jgi:hypothetical protein
MNMRIAVNFIAGVLLARIRHAQQGCFLKYMNCFAELPPKDLLDGESKE